MSEWSNSWLGEDIKEASGSMTPQAWLRSEERHALADYLEVEMKADHVVDLHPDRIPYIVQRSEYMAAAAIPRVLNMAYFRRRDVIWEQVWAGQKSVEVITSELALYRRLGGISAQELAAQLGFMGSLMTHEGAYAHIIPAAVLCEPIELLPPLSVAYKNRHPVAVHIEDFMSQRHSVCHGKDSPVLARIVTLIDEARSMAAREPHELIRTAMDFYSSRNERHSS